MIVRGAPTARCELSRGLPVANHPCENGAPAPRSAAPRERPANPKGNRINVLRKIAAVLLMPAMATIAAGGASAAQDAADLVLRHGTLYRVSAPGAVKGSVAVRGGHIVYLGDDAGVVPFVGPKSEVVELGGRAVTPGLIDAHSHLEGLGAFLEQVDLTGADSFDEVVRRVAERAAKTPAGAWVRGRGWDQNRWPDKSFPTHGALSAAVPNHPVWLERVDGHASLLNAAAMRAVRLTAADQDPAGGRILRDASGAPTGVLVDAATSIYEDRVPAPSAADHERFIAAGTRAAAALGLTTVTDMGIGAESAAAYRALQARHELPVRIAAFWSGSDARLPEWLAAGPSRSDDGFFTLRGVKLYADGALGSRGAARRRAQRRGRRARSGCRGRRWRGSRPGSPSRARGARSARARRPA